MLFGETFVGLSITILALDISITILQHDILEDWGIVVFNILGAGLCMTYPKSASSFNKNLQFM